jgi:Lecithin retinol acyltransferase
MNGRTHHGQRAQSNGARVSLRDRPLGAGEEPPLAAHLVSPRMFYKHHGIYVGEGRVVHYAGLAYGLRRGPVEQVSLERFARGRSICIQLGQRCFDRGQVVERALSRLGESHYRILTNNCEHFCEWALSDESRSGQIDCVRALPRSICRALVFLYQRLAMVLCSASPFDITPNTGAIDTDRAICPDPRHFGSSQLRSQSCAPR